MTPTDYLAACMVTPIATGYQGLEVVLDCAMDHLVQRVRTGGTVYLVGNGGSAAVVAHAHNDLVKAAKVRAMVFQDVPLLTACANDDGYGKSLAPLAMWAKAEDVLIAVSSSGASPNILAAAQIAQSRGAFIATCSGFQPTNPLRKLGCLNFYVPSSNYGHVELTHAALLHCLTDRLVIDAR